MSIFPEKDVTIDPAVLQYILNTVQERKENNNNICPNGARNKKLTVLSN
jgi:hypothetical protein